METIHFQKNAALLHNAASAGVEVNAADPRLLTAPFAHQRLDIGTISVQASGGQNIVFQGVPGAPGITFHAGVKGFAGVGIFLDGSSMQAALQLDPGIGDALDLPSGPARHYTLLRWGFDATASVNGSMALGAGGAVTLGLDLSADAVYAVIRRFDDGARSGLQELDAVVNSWRMPVHVNSDADLDPGTWLVAETGGSLALKLGAQYGLNYNWVRQSALRGLTGDIGLRLQLGIQAALGFTAAGTFVLVLSRESPDSGNRQIRLRLFRRAERGWNFALNAGATVQPQVPLPGQADSFIQAVFGVYGTQVINDLHVLEQWTGNQNTLGGLLADAGLDRVQQLVKAVTGIDPAVAFSEAQAPLKSFLAAWEGLPHRITSLLFELAARHADLGEIRQVAGLLAGNNTGAVTALLQEKLKDIAFTQTPLGQYLEAGAASGLVSLLDSAQLSGLRKIANDTLALLDNGKVEGVFRALQNELVKALDLGPLLNQAQKMDQTTFNSLDALLKAKLAAFLDKSVKQLGLQDVEKIRLAMGTLLSRRQEFYDKARQAVERRYSFDFAAAWQSDLTRTALVDVTFDFSQDAGGLSGLLQDAVAGRLDRVLIEPLAGVTLGQGLLTHELKRSRHVEFHMPYFSATSDELLTTQATALAADRDGARVLLYDLRSQDQITARVGAGFGMSSSLAVAVHFGVVAGGPLRIYDSASLTYSYDFRLGRRGTTTAALGQDLAPYLAAYFQQSFTRGATAQQWLGLLESKAGAQGGIAGNTLVKLQLSVPSSTGAAWFSRPADDDQARRDLSIALQVCLKRIIPFYFFSDLRNFDAVGPGTAALLVYSAIPARAQDGSFYWDFRDPAEVSGMIGRAVNNNTLDQCLQAVSTLLTAAASRAAPFYGPQNRSRILGQATSSDGLLLLQGLFFNEAEIVAGAMQARDALLRFLAAGSSEPSPALEALRQFGTALVTTFHQRITSIYAAGGALRPLGALAFLEAARALDPTVAPGANVILDVAFLKPGVDPSAFLDGDPQQAQVVAADRLFAAGVQPALPSAF